MPIRTDTTSTYENVLLDLTQQRLPDIHKALNILDDTMHILIHEPNLLRIESPCSVVGDIHGQFKDLLLFATENKTFVFLGDYVDRGTHSVEVLLFLCLKKLLFRNVYLIKGNHEMASQNAIYGFRMECLHKYDISFYSKANELFETMSIAGIVDNRYFLVHGGISPFISRVEQIMSLDRTDFHSFHPLIWSDPHDTSGFTASPRGAGFLFGMDVLDTFLDGNGLEYLVRSHQLVMEGHRIMGRCIFVWSAPNYCNTMGNVASIMNISRTGFDFYTFEAAEKQRESLQEYQQG